jgi:hypothetical protein
LTGAAVAAALAQGAASASAPLLSLTPLAQAAALFAAGRTATAGGVSASVAALTEGVLKAMLLSKLKIVTTVLLTLAVVGVGAVLFTAPAPAQPPASKYVPTDTTSPYQESAPKTKAYEPPQDNTSPYADPRTKKPKDPAQETTLPKLETRPGLLLRHAIIDEVNAEKRTLSVTVDGGPGRLTTGEPTQKLVGLPVDGNAVRIGDKPAPLTALKRGMSVSLELTVAQDQLVVVAVRTADGTKPPVGNPDEEQVKRLARLEAQAEAAKADVLVARANAEVAKAKLEAARVLAELAKGETERLQAKVALQLASNELDRAVAETSLAEVKLKQAVAELEQFKRSKEPRRQ